MSMPCSITGDLSIGHAGFSPSPITALTTDVLVMGVPPHVKDDIIGAHVLGNSVHTGKILKVSTKVMTSKGTKGVARLMDKGDCGALILGTGATVMVGS
jgi:uncharacterized Zn-binding protein involved in type VI secretion